jgi:O-acetyl-ADP-ribose deacetylase (regulator of RNase III)
VYIFPGQFTNFHTLLVPLPHSRSNPNQACRYRGSPEMKTPDKRTTAGSSLLLLRHGDITVEDTDAIVNAANSSLLGGGGVDGAIHRAGGPAILEECRNIRASRGGCPTGEAVVTGGGNLKARYVIHTVGPVWQGGDAREDHLLRQAYLNSLSLACSLAIHSLSFPSISTGVYGFPIHRACLPVDHIDLSTRGIS